MWIRFICYAYINVSFDIAGQGPVQRLLFNNLGDARLMCRWTVISTKELLSVIWFQKNYYLTLKNTSVKGQRSAYYLMACNDIEQASMKHLTMASNIESFGKKAQKENMSDMKMHNFTECCR